jgi:phosphatidylglycerophosphatase C
MEVPAPHGGRPAPNGRRPRGVAAFDVDGTLTRGGSVARFVVAVVGWRRLLRGALRHLPSVLLGPVVGGRAADRAKERLFEATLGGTPLADAEAAARRFAEAHLARRGRPDVLVRLAAHRQAGHLVVLVSASPTLYVARLGELLQADGVVATELAVDQAGRLTGRLAGANCRGAEKARRLAAWLAAHGAEGAELWAYGNSAGDRELLARADHPVHVGRLGRLGRLRRFPRLAVAPLPQAPVIGSSSGAVDGAPDHVVEPGRR